VRRAGDSAERGLASGRRSGSGASQLAVDGLPAAQRPSLLRWKSHQQSVGPVGRSLWWT